MAEHPRAAHEKIAADLAFDLGLPVPPVTLWDRKSVAAGKERFTSIGAVPFTPVYKWGEFKNSPSRVARLAGELRSAASAMVAFDTWIGNGDRVNEGNVLFQEDSAFGFRWAYIDHANSLSLGWKTGESWKNVQPVPVYPVECGPPDLLALSAAVDEIEALGESTIEEIVNRVPKDFLVDDLREVIRKGLLLRRSNLRTALRSQHTGML